MMDKLMKPSPDKITTVGRILKGLVDKQIKEEEKKATTLGDDVVKRMEE
jgi:hypothetical protein